MDVIRPGEMREPANQYFWMKLFKCNNSSKLDYVYGFRRRISRQPLLSCTVHNPALPGRAKDRKPGILRRREKSTGPGRRHRAWLSKPAILTPPHKRVIGLYGE
jgi:hypothetical protein